MYRWFLILLLFGQLHGQSQPAQAQDNEFAGYVQAVTDNHDSLARFDVVYVSEESTSRYDGAIFLVKERSRLIVDTETNRYLYIRELDREAAMPEKKAPVKPLPPSGPVVWTAVSVDAGGQVLQFHSGRGLVRGRFKSPASLRHHSIPSFFGIGFGPFRSTIVGDESARAQILSMTVPRAGTSLHEGVDDDGTRMVLGRRKNPMGKTGFSNLSIAFDVDNLMPFRASQHVGREVDGESKQSLRYRSEIEWSDENGVYVPRVISDTRMKLIKLEPKKAGLNQIYTDTEFKWLSVNSELPFETIQTQRITSIKYLRELLSDADWTLAEDR